MVAPTQIKALVKNGAGLTALKTAVDAIADTTLEYYDFSKKSDRTAYDTAVAAIVKGTATYKKKLVQWHERRTSIMLLIVDTTGTIINLQLEAAIDYETRGFRVDFTYE